MVLVNYMLRMAKPNKASTSDLRVEGKQRPRRWFLWVFLVVLGLGAATIGWLVYGANAALSKISDAPANKEVGGLLPFLTNNQNTQLLQGEKDDRINILLLGIGGANHPGGTLTDTMMLLSIKPNEKKAALLSIPRDLYVTIPGYGSAKINAAHALGEQRQAGQGPALSMETVSQVLDLPIQYYVRLDFQGFKDLVNTLGGLDINVDKAISDPFYPDDNTIGYAPFYLKAGPTHMNGDLALKYARSRETTSDFDRSRRQQQILSAIKAKLLSLGTLTNPKKLSDLFNIAGDHVRTNLAVWEMERLAGILKDINTGSITNTVLDTSASGPLVGRTDPRAGYIILPRKGDFSDVQAIARNLFNDNPTLPAATVAIENASGQADIGGNVALILRGYGYQVTSVTNAKTPRAKSQILEKNLSRYPDLTTFLTERFTVRAQTASSGQISTDALLVIGEDYLPVKTK